MSAARSLVDTHLRNLKATGKRHEVPDPGATGLSVLVSPKGQKAWTVVYRVWAAVSGERVACLAGEKRRVTLGEYPTIGLAGARAKSAEIKRLARVASTLVTWESRRMSSRGHRLSRT